MQVRHMLSLDECLGLNKIDKKRYNLSAGQINGAFQSALGRPATGGEISQYSGDSSLEGSPGQAALVSRLNPSASSGGASSGSGYGAADAVATAKALRDFTVESNQPAISTLTDQKGSLQAQYDKLVGSIRTEGTVATNAATLAASNELGKRGITGDSSLGQSQIASAILPTVANEQSQETAATGALTTDQLNLAGQIANLQAGNPSGAITGATSLASLAAQIQAAKIAANAPIGVGAGGAVINPATGQVIKASSFAPTPTGPSVTSPGSNVNAGPAATIANNNKNGIASLVTKTNNPAFTLPLSSMGGSNSPSATLR